MPECQSHSQWTIKKNEKGRRRINRKRRRRSWSRRRRRNKSNIPLINDISSQIQSLVSFLLVEKIERYVIILWCLVSIASTLITLHNSLHVHNLLVELCVLYTFTHSHPHPHSQPHSHSQSHFNFYFRFSCSSPVFFLETRIR